MHTVQTSVRGVRDVMIYRFAASINVLFDTLFVQKRANEHSILTTLRYLR